VAQRQASQAKLALRNAEIRATKAERARLAERVQRVESALASGGTLVVVPDKEAS